MLVNNLLRRHCLLKRFTTNCSKCLERARFGQEIFSALIFQTENAFGIRLLEEQCAHPDDRFIYALLNGLILLRQMEYRNRFIQRYKPISVLLTKVSSILIETSSVSFEGKSAFWRVSRLSARNFRD